jgi:hypothetical protein
LPFQAHDILAPIGRLLSGCWKSICANEISKVSVAVDAQRADFQPLVGSSPPEFPDRVPSFDRFVVRREENGVLGIELHEGVGIAAIGGGDVPGYGGLYGLVGGRVGGNPGGASCQARHREETHHTGGSCHFGFNLARLPNVFIRVCLADR